MSDRSATEDDDVVAQFGRTVRALRQEKGYSQEAFADLCGLDRSYMGGVERGERNLSIRKVALIARSLDMSLAELFSAVGEAEGSVE